ncbi:MAG: FecR domain-containing protein [Bacteroidales bacterium]|jgi:ferric-dicitrate binding protein FerR (iron transport regulator)|nr:FecR domain-containing protein [Bacteroidales bacterium]MBR4686704.1 FecR domain-containing protein [Bacteroidales bacterium]MBR6883043.1 FecR domain-containing protein [Bacteroidales bacterium]
MLTTDKFPGWDRVDGSSVSETEIEEAFQAVMDHALRLEAASLSLRRRRKARWLAALVGVAAALFLFAVPYSAYRYVQTQQPEPVLAALQEYTTAQGEVREVLLPDGSKVVLNAESVLICPDRFGAERSVYLSGEAIFDVTASETEPFLVRTSDMTVRVHGTRFNVKAYFDDPQVTATLNRGSIAVWPNQSPERRVELQPEQFFAFDRATGSVIRGKVNSAEAMSWEGGNLCFRSESIYEIIRVIQRRYGVHVYLTTSRYDREKITARFVHGETVDELLDAICSVIPGMKYERTDEGIRIR